MLPVSGFFILYLVLFNLNMSVQKGVLFYTLKIFGYYDLKGWMLWMN